MSFLFPSCKRMEVDTQPFCVKRDPKGKALLNGIGEK